MHRPRGFVAALLLLACYIDSYGNRHADADAQPANTTLNQDFFDRSVRIDHILVERGRFEFWTRTSC